MSRDRVACGFPRGQGERGEGGQVGREWGTFPFGREGGTHPAPLCWQDCDVMTYVRETCGCCGKWTVAFLQR